MKVSNKLLVKLFLLFLVCGLGFACFCLLSMAYFDYGSYESYLVRSTNDNIYSLYLEQPKLPAPGYSNASVKNYEYAEYYEMWHDYYLESSNNFYNEYKICLVFGIVCTFVFISVTCFTIKYLVKTNKFINQVKRYKDFMTSTNQYTIDAIAEEFGETQKTVEINIQNAIDRQILKNVYLSKQTKELLIVNKSQESRVQGNVQNVNVENNVFIDNNKNI